MREKSKAIRAIIEIAVVVLVIFAVYFIVRQIDHNSSKNEVASETGTEQVWKEFEQKDVTIKINKKKYTLDHPVKTYLFLGTDKSGNEEATDDEYQGSMADALMLVVIDEQEKSYGILQLNRDTITEVPMLLADVTANASAKMQLCTAHWYGKDKTASCENTVKSFIF